MLQKLYSAKSCIHFLAEPSRASRFVCCFLLVSEILEISLSPGGLYAAFVQDGRSRAANVTWHCRDSSDILDSLI